MIEPGMLKVLSNLEVQKETKLSKYNSEINKDCPQISCKQSSFLKVKTENMIAEVNDESILDTIVENLSDD